MTYTTSFPDTLNFDRHELEDLFSLPADVFINNHPNKYLNDSVVVLNTASTSYAENKLLRLRLSYFPNAFLWVQVNGGSSTQMFMMSDDKSVFYKGQCVNDKLVLAKCPVDQLVSG